MSGLVDRRQIYLHIRDVWLRSLAGLELSTVGEGDLAESLWAVGAALVNEPAHGVGVVIKTTGEIGVGGRVAVVRKELSEVVGDLLGLLHGHAWVALFITIVSALGDWVGDGGNGEKAGGDGEGTHFDFY